MTIPTDLLVEVGKYYSDKITKFGDTPQGVDWNGSESQTIRFAELCKVINSKESRFSINDLGCGYGALLDHLQSTFPHSEYLGVDISLEMIQFAKKRYSNFQHSRFIASSEPDQKANYGLASGIFNVRLGRSDSEWFDYIESTLEVMNRTSINGFAFNCLTSYSDDDKKRDDLYYANPCTLFDLCKRRYSSQVALLHDYGLYEFTILVKKIS